METMKMSTCVIHVGRQYIIIIILNSKYFVFLFLIQVLDQEWIWRKE